jgi:hypothetical protein
MSVLDTTRLIIYRCHQKGLEILLINNDLDGDPEIWKIPSLDIASTNSNQVIQLEHTLNEDGQSVQTIAIEGDWHDIPSIRGIIKHDVKRVKMKIKSLVPSLEQGSYFTIKEAFRKVLPNEYQALKELKDIILDKNLSTY